VQFHNSARKVKAKLSAVVPYLILPVGTESSIFSTAAVVQYKTSQICHFGIGLWVLTVVSGKKHSRAAFLSLFLGAGKLIPPESVAMCWVFLSPPGQPEEIQSFTMFPKICHWGQMLDYLWYESATWFLATSQEPAEGCMVCAQAS